MAELKHPETILHIVLGGGIGSGKSTVGRRLELLGATVVDADRLGHTVLEPGGEAFGSVCERWPSVVVDHRIDRGALAKIVFAEEAQLTKLEAMTHPPIINRINQIGASADDLVVEIPLILDVPGDWTKVFVDADEDIRLRRAVDRGGDVTDVRSRMASQPRRDEWLAWQDHVIDNSGSIGYLEEQADTLWYGLRATGDGLPTKP